MSLKSRLTSLSTVDCSEKMYSCEGAQFQEWALQFVTPNNKPQLVQSGLIGSLVTDINNGNISVDKATQQFNNALFADFR